ncbi:MAG: Uma2 family endonuclease [Myxococcaceae bacterium]
MRAPAKSPATYEDLKRVPENLVGEIVAGELWTSPRPALGHAHSASVLGGELLGPFGRGKGGPGGWWILDEPEIHLTNDVVVPDLAGWRRERLAKTPAPDEPFMSLVPDWVCEVLSPSTARLDRVLKNHIYARDGVGHLWFIDPVGKTLEIFRLSEGKWLEVGAFSDEKTIRAEPFEAIELELAALWLPLP